MYNFRAFVSIFVLIIFFSCKKDAPVEQPLNDLLMSGGSWTISALTNPFDTSTHYIGCTLVFHNDGKMQAQSTSVSRPGTWRAYTVPDNVIQLEIDLEGDDFLYMESYWTLITMTPTKLELSSGFLVATYMTLVKN